VVTTFYPLQYLAQRIGGERADVIGLVPPGVEPHDWEPTPQDIMSINKASVFIYQGAGLEPWAARTVASLPSDKPIVVEATEGFALKPGIPEEEGEGTRAESSDEPVLDPHIWLNPQLYKKQAQAVRNALVKADPESEAIYQDNLVSLEKDLDELDSEMERGLSSCQRHTIVTSHAAFAYLADRYGLQQLAVTGLSPDAEPSPARLREIIQQVRDEGANHIFFETLVSPAISETVAKEVGAQTLVLDPIEGLTLEEITARADYFSVQRQNLANLRIALGCS
jgi:zinc transport system substrate-binding protein